MAAPRIAVVIPALDEEEAIGAVIREIPPVVHEVIVVDNGSRDRTADVARAAGACPDRAAGGASASPAPSRPQARSSSRRDRRRRSTAANGSLKCAPA